jgi:FAD/FMN-containing dehydrogenase
LSYWHNRTSDQDPYTITDYSRLRPVNVDRVVNGRKEEQLVALIRDAAKNKQTVSIAGQRHSQGGHTYYKDGVVVDMSSFNRILSFWPNEKKIRVQAGVTWGDIQEKINPYGLSVQTMQSQNIFTVGGSISINAHGRDIRNGSLIQSVESFRLLTASGDIIEVSRETNAELFTSVLGGYGLFGIILDVTLTLTDDEMYRMEITETTVDAYSRYFTQQLFPNPDVVMHIARISVAPDRFLSDMYAIQYVRDHSSSLEEHRALSKREAWVIPSKVMFQLNRLSPWGKELFWKAQKSVFADQQGKMISRNNAMRSESAFMEYHNAGSNDLLQEYFIPVDQFAPFVHEMRTILNEESMNLLNITVRYVSRDQEALLSYATEDSFALVCLFHTSLSESAQTQFQNGIRRIIDQVIAHRGTYYLPYAPFPTVEQFRAAYPQQQRFFDMKDRYDPQHLFMNYFYEDYMRVYP